MDDSLNTYYVDTLVQSIERISQIDKDLSLKLAFALAKRCATEDGKGLMVDGIVQFIMNVGDTLNVTLDRKDIVDKVSAFVNRLEYGGLPEQKTGQAPL